MKLKATASPRGGVGSSRKRTDGLQDDEPDSAGCGGEPTALGRSLGLTDPSDALRRLSKRRSGHITWVGVGRPEGRAG
jgi:hypothetical protein